MHYLKYVWVILKHKWYVMLGCFRFKLYRQGIVHDMSRFKPSEFIPHANFLYGKKAEKNKERLAREVGISFKQHWKSNKHHWEYWVKDRSIGEASASPMPLEYAIEMICDWESADRVFNNATDTGKWYNDNKDRIILHPTTRLWVEDYIFGR